MKYIEAPNREDIDRSIPSIFLGGSISNCKDWQTQLINRLNKLDITIVNPRRSDFDITNKSESVVQINWEYDYLRLTNIVIFYFSNETLSPITLFELGGAIERIRNSDNKQQIIVHCHPDYQRKLDVEYQIKKSLSIYDVSQLHYLDDYDDFVHKLINLIDGERMLIKKIGEVYYD